MDRSSHPSRTSNYLVASGLLLLAAAVGYLWYTFMGPGRYLEAARFKEHLAQLPGVTHVEVFGHDDIGYEISGFALEVAGHGTLHLGMLSHPDPDPLEKIHIYRIGDPEVLFTMEGPIGVGHGRTGAPLRSTGHGNGFTVGTKGAHTHLFPFRLHSVADVVERFDDILAVISTWPVQPQYAQFVDSEGVRWFYALADPKLGDRWLQPAELE